MRSRSGSRRRSRERTAPAGAASIGATATLGARAASIGTAATLSARAASIGTAATLGARAASIGATATLSARAASIGATATLGAGVAAIGVAATLGAGAALGASASPSAARRAGVSAEVAKGAAPRTAASSPTAAEQRNIAPRDLTARTARTVRVDDQAHLHLVKASGPLLIERGAAKGSLPGSALVHMHVGSRVTATFTITTSHGSISGSGSASLKSSGRYTSFGGTLKVSSGTRRYAHAHGSGSLYGVIDRRTHAVTVKTAGSLYY